jgi:uncharacterized protein YjbI with pentapeptide repeats
VSKKELIARWEHDVDFRKSVDFALDKILSKSELRGEVDLRGITIGNEGPVKELWNANLAGCKFTQVDFSCSILEGSFKNAVFEGVNFSEAEFEQCILHSASFATCSFSRAKIKTTTMDDAYFLRCDFSSAELRGKGIALGYGARRAKFIECDFTNAKLLRLEYRACLFERCTFEGATFAKCVLSGVKFEGQAPSARQFESCEVRRTFLNGTELVIEQ